MMKYENRLPDESVNTTRVHPLKQFVQLLLGAVVLILLLVVFLQFTGSALAKKIPFSYELAVMDRLDIDFADEDKYPEITAYLNQLAARVMQHLPVPEEVRITVHYSPDPVFNAFATVGGNLMFYKGLLSKIPDENTLAMVMAHEISHVLHRDPVASLGGGVVSTIALLGLTGNAGTGMAGSVLSNAGVLTSIQFSRQMEVAADKQAVAAMHSLYGHVNGASGLFELFREARGGDDSRTGWGERFLSTHPLDDDRIQSIESRAQAEGWSLQGALTELPAGFSTWLE
ncbi:MAG: M48 family metallopeptidase [Granulosicoccus sp.]